MKKKVSLYQFYNIDIGDYGEPFGMCEFHFKKYNPPSNCVMNKLAEKSLVGCNHCEQEVK